MSQATILIVEDNEISRKMVRVALAAEGYAVLEAPDGRTALALAAGPTPPDLVLQDLALPDMDGGELLGRLRTLPALAEAPIVAVSGFLSRAEASRALGAGFTDFVVKPVEPSRLLDTVRALLPARAPGRPTPSTRGHHVVVVDDDPIQLKLARILLTQRGFEVVAAVDGADALEKIRRSPPDGVLSDVLMPRLDGYQLCLAIRLDARLAGIPVVLCSANYVEGWDQRLAARVGASAMTVRTPDLGEAVRALETAMEHGVAPAPEGRVEALEAERLHRVALQLERQVGLNVTLLQRASLQAAILSMMATLPDVVAGAGGIEAAPLDALARVLDGAGVSSGALYLTGPDGRLRFQHQLGLRELAPGALEGLFDHPEIFARAVEFGRILALPSPAVPEPAARDLLARAGVASAVIVPLLARGECLGVLLLAARRRDLTHADWVSFAQAIGNQVAHTVALGQAFSRLAASEARYRDLFDRVPVGIFRTTLDGQILAVNPTLVELLGFPSAEALRATDFAALWVDPEGARRLRARAEREEVVRGVESELRRWDGATIWARANVQLRREGSGEAVLEGSLEDISDRRRADQRARAEYTVTRALAESATLAAAAPRILEGLCRLLGWEHGALWVTDEAADDFRCLEVWPPRPATAAPPTLPPGGGLPGRACARGEAIWAPDLTGASDLGEPGDALRARCVVPIRMEEGAAVIELASREARPCDEDLLRMLAGIASQIGGFIERLVAREAFERQRATLVQTEKLAAMGQLLAGVAHELNNPLSVVMGQAALLVERTDDGPLAERSLKIAQAAERCARIVRNFLALARQQPAERREVRLNDVVREAVELLAYPLRVDGVDVRLELASGLPVLWADPHQLHQVMVNLVTNAHQAMRQTPPPRRLTVTSRRAERCEGVLLVVEDTGPGIPAEIRARIFEPFFTTKPEGQGTGLGLSLCQGIVAEHGGVIGVSDAPGRGTVFRVELPVQTPPGPAPEAGPRAIEEPARAEGRRILVVDDEPELGDLVADILAADRHQVETVSSGLAALERLRTEHYDLILCDLKMPGLDGPGLYREVRSRYPARGHRFIFMTGDTLSADTREFLDRAGVPSLSKPFGASDVARAVRQVLARP